MLNIVNVKAHYHKHLLHILPVQKDHCFQLVLFIKEKGVKVAHNQLSPKT